MTIRDTYTFGLLSKSIIGYDLKSALIKQLRPDLHPTQWEMFSYGALIDRLNRWKCVASRAEYKVITQRLHLTPLTVVLIE